MGDPPITRSALSWLRETDTLTMETLKKAYWEVMSFHPVRYGILEVRNESYLHPHQHAYEVGVNQHGIVHHCTCPAYEFHSRVCKHMVAVALAIDAGRLDLVALGCKEDVIERTSPEVRS